MVTGSQNVVIRPRRIDGITDTGLRIEGQRRQHPQDGGKRVVGAAKGYDNQPFQIAGSVNAAAILGFRFLQQSVALPVAQRVHGDVQGKGGLCSREKQVVGNTRTPGKDLSGNLYGRLPILFFFVDLGQIDISEEQRLINVTGCTRLYDCSSLFPQAVLKDFNLKGQTRDPKLDQVVIREYPVTVGFSLRPRNQPQVLVKPHCVGMDSDKLCYIGS